MKGLRVTAGVVNAVCLMLLILYFSVQLPTFSPWFYSYEYEKNGTYEVVNMEKDDLMAVTTHMIDYMRGKEAKLNVETRVSGEERLFFSETEVLHMEDVRGLFDMGRLIRNVSAVLFIATTVFLVWQKRKGILTMLKCWRAAVLSMLAAGVGLSVLIALGFDRAFIVFHEIFFSNDLWLLDPADLLVNIVPTPFFMDIAMFIGVTFALVLAVVGTSAAVILRNNKSNS